MVLHAGAVHVQHRHIHAVMVRHLVRKTMGSAAKAIGDAVLVGQCGVEAAEGQQTLGHAACPDADLITGMLSSRGEVGVIAAESIKCRILVS